VVLGLLVTSGIVLMIRVWRVFQSGYEIRVYFETAGGLVAGAPVKFAGVEVGEVKDIRIIRGVTASASTQVELRLWLPEGLAIRADDQVLIGMLGLLGEKYVEILPGLGQGRVLKEGDALVGAGAVSELELTQRLARVLSQLEETLTAANRVVNDFKITQRWESTLAQAEGLTKRLDQTAQQAEVLIRQWRRVGEQGSSFIEDARRWAPVIAIGIALFIYLATR
jgi:phospholipid/cholesterol/gamma-HCH transport system substrate-binding protein